HHFQIMQRRFISEMSQRLAHLGKEQFWFIAKAEQGFGTSRALAGPHDFHHLVRRHGLRARLTRIATERAVPAVVAAKTRQRKKDLARIRDDARLESST